MEKDYFNVADIFGENVFNDATMQERLPKKTYQKLKETIRQGRELDIETADVVAHEMKEWAIEKGATHYTHWFQPLTGVTAEKHDSFISAPKENGKILMSFSGKELIKGEPDASSFPSGGLRATFEARGYTAWDPTSPAFVRQDAAGATLCIPTAFCSYTGEALDQKTPLLRSMEAINKQSIRLIRLFGNTTSNRVTPSVGVEQEYFLIDRENFLARKDLVYTGRTLLGAMPPKGQEMDDHYFGAIRERIAAFMKDVNIELWKLGVSSKTQHNEVAPAQHELAPIYAEANVAVDHNQLIMETLKKVAYRHGLQCLLHEKPFAGVNGSGKHDNWSLVTDDGINLLEPGKTPHENVQFLLVLCCILKAVDEHADLLRESAADVGNDNRLGGDEAPPCIISVYLGEQLQDVLDQLIRTGTADHSISGEKLDTGVTTLPDFLKDATDRNRTSPFAFTGNKFEFRMVGSEDSVGEPNIVLNTIVAQAFAEACDELEKAKDFNMAVHDLIKKLAKDHQRIVFNGNGYSPEWAKEAKKRGLSIINNMLDAIPALTSEKSISLFEEFNVFTKAELESRAEIEYEIYAKKRNIEAKVMIDIVRKQIIPATIRYTTVLAESVNQVRSAAEAADVSTQVEMLTEVSACLKDTKEKLVKLEEYEAKGVTLSDTKERAFYYRDYVLPAMEAVRKPVDRLEMLVDKSMWPMPSYGDMIFEV
ncbi:MAG: glutamine synthetase III [Lachnospiraceae bacterium]|nr:glutamine synthetase III [Lachnospiraceae bacterium]